MTTNPTLVTIDRVIAAAWELGITLDDGGTGRSAQANINGLAVLAVLLDTVLIVRADAGTDIPSNSPDAAIYLAANQVNSTFLDARAIVVNRGETLVVRTEAETSVAAGLSDAQLTAALRAAFDGIVACQDAMVGLTEDMERLREEQ
ncbi:YbjN domain-containing protein [Corynebacterium sp. CNCTC7651]|uniref:YbjN domain-containing protein n=1 Tax=Corynebacterium sp. CNCTC7651 TaxID=2815361 RepID=UPI001F38EE1D|nr:YbjN domain-containing protein [Corynebacterium sp. CNCTC7651]UIZ93239.1 YbjN domain-containing protein [Corynebacterium sp. CNCTC7651]